MRTPSSLRSVLLAAGVLALSAAATLAGETIQLFDGKSLAGWKPSKNRW